MVSVRQTLASVTFWFCAVEKDKQRSHHEAGNVADISLLSARKSLKMSAPAIVYAVKVKFCLTNDDKEDRKNGSSKTKR